MLKETVTTGKLDSMAEELFIDLFNEVFGPKNSKYISTQHSFVDIYGNYRYIDFAMEAEGEKIAIEIDGESYHNPDRISSNKYYDDLLKQNSLIGDNWKVYRWAYLQLKNQPEKIKDEIATFIGEFPVFREMEDYLPKQKGKIIKLKNHQEDAIDNLQEMRKNGDSIALLYHATGTGKTVTVVSDAKKVGERTLFIGHTKELISQARDAFRDIWEEKHVGMYVAEEKEKDSYVVCASIQSISRNIEEFKEDDFGYIIYR